MATQPIRFALGPIDLTETSKGIHQGDLYLLLDEDCLRLYVGNKPEQSKGRIVGEGQITYSGGYLYCEQWDSEHCVPNSVMERYAPLLNKHFAGRQFPIETIGIDMQCPEHWQIQRIKEWADRGYEFCQDPVKFEVDHGLLKKVTAASGYESRTLEEKIK